MTESDTKTRQERATAWFEQLRDRICAAFEDLEDSLTDNPGGRSAGRFERKSWQRETEGQEQGGGGVMSVMRGRVFEKVGVNVSTVSGTFSEQFRERIPGAAEDGRFWAGGISLVYMVAPFRSLTSKRCR